MKPTPNKRVSSASQRKQQHLLDVKIRVGKERERRVRAVAGFLCKTVLIVALGVGAWLGGNEAWRRFVWENPDYFVREPEVKTDGTLTREQILATAEIVEGRNILTVDLGKARAALENLPQVESAEVQRAFPNRVSIIVTERRPIAWVTQKKDDDATTSERAYLIDARGIPLRSRVLLPEYYHLPIISGVETENLVAGQRANAFDIQAAIRLVQLNAESTRFQMRNIDLSKGYCLVVTDQRRATVTFGFDKIDAQLAKLGRLLDVIEPTHREIRTINLIPERNIPVTFYDPTEDIVKTDDPPVIDTTLPKVPTKGTNGTNTPPKPVKRGTKKPAAKDRPAHAAKKPDVKPPEPETKPASPVSEPSPVEHLKKRFNVNG